jgi:hypothetical protein
MLNIKLPFFRDTLSVDVDAVLLAIATITHEANTKIVDLIWIYIMDVYIRMYSNNISNISLIHSHPIRENPTNYNILTNGRGR